jgi:oligo-alginate lyase
VLLDESGLAAAIGVRDGSAEPFNKQSVNLSDGPDGKQGGVAILRYGNEDLSLVFKYAAQGSSHGHYDKLAYSLYQQGNEVLQDYGLVRFVNISQKGGGNYLPENSSWAKQTIAHNTLVQNETSHFNGDYATASQYHPDLHFYSAKNDNMQVVSAKDSHAYPGTTMQRTLAMLKLESAEKPMVLDILKVISTAKNQYDLPFYYMGQVIETNFTYTTPKTLSALGNKNGYQHLYLEAKGKATGGTGQFTWLVDASFYTITTATQPTDELLLTRLGANDPEFNLRRDAGLMLRRQASGNTVFATMIEPHGGYDKVAELSEDAVSQFAEIKVVYDDEQFTAVSITDVSGHSHLFIVVNNDATMTRKHMLQIDGKPYRWTGPYFFIEGGTLATHGPSF